MLEKPNVSDVFGLCSWFYHMTHQRSKIVEMGGEPNIRSLVVPTTSIAGKTNRKTQ